MSKVMCANFKKFVNGLSNYLTEVYSKFSIEFFKKARIDPFFNKRHV